MKNSKVKLNNLKQLKEMETPIKNPDTGIVEGSSESQAETTQNVAGVSDADDTQVGQPDGDQNKPIETTEQNNANVVNPIAPTVPITSIPEPTERAVPVPDAADEPVSGDDKYDKLLAAFNKLADRGNDDADYIRGLKREAGII